MSCLFLSPLVYSISSPVCWYTARSIKSDVTLSHSTDARLLQVRLREGLGRVYKGIKTDGRAWLMMAGPGCPSMMLLLQPYLATTPSKNVSAAPGRGRPIGVSD